MILGLILFIIGGSYLIAKEFYVIALSKGHNHPKYFWYCFLFGIAGYLLIIALPNIMNQKFKDM